MAKRKVTLAETSARELATREIGGVLPDRAAWYSWREYLDAVGEDVADEGSHVGGILATRNQSVNGTASFTQSESFGEAMELARHGWGDMADEIAGFSRTVRESAIRDVSSNRVEFAFGRGGVPNVTRFLQGRDDCYRRAVFVSAPRAGRVIRLAVPIAASAFVRGASLVWRGAAYIAFSDLCAAAGLGVEVWAIDGVMAQNAGPHRDQLTTTCHAVRVAESSEPLDMARIAFALAHPSMLRRVTFRVSERYSAATQAKLGRGYGVPHLNAAAVERTIGELVGDPDTLVVAPPMNQNGGQDMAMQVLRQLVAKTEEKLGVNIMNGEGR